MLKTVGQEGLTGIKPHISCSESQGVPEETEQEILTLPTRMSQHPAISQDRILLNGMNVARREQ